MLNIKTLSILAIAGTAVAAPSGWNWEVWGNSFRAGDSKDSDNTNDKVGNYFGNYRGGNYNGGNKPPAAETTVPVVTAYTTVTYGGNGNWGGKPSATPEPAAPSPAPAAPKEPEASPSPAPVASGSTDGYMGTVSSWRSKMGLSALSEDSKLVGNALKTAQDGNGQMVHQLNPGSFAQVLAPGDAGDFEKVFVGGWLCEMPNLPGLDGVCATMSQGWAYEGQTGHAEILSSSKYSKIGCANAGGIWSCDLA